MANGTKWNFEADYLQACSCDFGCPCEFEAPPSRGFCEGVGAWHIIKGKYGDVPLDGLGLGFSIRTPGPMHKGNGTGAIFIDEKANQAQRDALTQIGTGKAGGLPYEIFPVIISNLLPPQYVRFEFNFNGRHSTARIGNAVTIAMEPIKNPVSGEPESIRVEHATGFIFKSAEVVAARECKSSAGGVLTFDWPNQAGFVTRVQYGN